MRKVWGAVVVVVTLGLSIGCSGPTAAKKTEITKAEEKRSAIPVEARLPLRGPISEYFETTTRVSAERSVQVTSEGVGTCQKVYKDEGDKVSVGDPLVELDKAELEAQLRSANAQLAKLRSDYARASEMLKEDLISRSEYDNARYGYEQQLASVNQLQVQLGNMTVRAPISGVITKKMVQVGQLLTSGTPCFEIVDPKSYILAINPPEKLLPRIKVGQEAKVVIDALQSEGFTAKVRKINPAVDPASGTVKVTLDFDSATLSKLRDQAFARVSLVLDTRANALLAPKDAVLQENARKYVFIIEEQSGDAGTEMPAPADDELPPLPREGATLIANRVEVQTGLEDSTHVEIVSGLSDVTPIVTVGHQTLKSGSEVKLTSAEEELLAKTGLSVGEALEQAKKEREEGAKKVDGTGM